MLNLSKQKQNEIIFLSVAILLLWTIFFTNLFEKVSIKLIGETYSIASVNGLDAATIREIKPRRSYDKAYIRIAMDYELTPFEGGYPNLFQTDDVNEGIRLEFAKNAMATIYATGDPAAPGVLQMGKKLKFNKVNHIEIEAVDREYVQINDSNYGGYINGGAVPVLPNFSINRIMIGRGFNDDRRFSGKIYNATVAICDISTFRKVIWSLYALTAVLFGALIVVMRRKVSAKKEPTPI